VSCKSRVVGGQALEAALPETAERLMRMIAELAEAGPDHRFAAGQLLVIASTCMVRPTGNILSSCMAYPQCKPYGVPCAVCCSAVRDSRSGKKSQTTVPLFHMGCVSPDTDS
jgi:hypothetical protein